MQAQMAQYFQFQALFEGFRHHAFEYYSAVVFWKSQSPWPALRGAFYDSYLAQTGGFYGVRTACSEPVHVQLNQATRTVAVVSRLGLVLKDTKVSAAWFRLDTGQQVGTTRARPVATVRANGVTQVPGGALPWPTAAGMDRVLLLRLRLESLAHDPKVFSTNEYWLAPRGDGTAPSKAAWSRFRQWAGASSHVAVAVKATAAVAAGSGASHGMLASSAVRISVMLRHAAPSNITLGVTGGRYLSPIYVLLLPLVWLFPLRKGGMGAAWR